MHGNLSNPSAETVCLKSGKQLPLVARLMSVAHRLWPSKTDIELSNRSGACDRTCRYWLQRNSGLSLEHFEGLLQSDDGLAFLEAMMGSAKPRWWKKVKRAAEREIVRSELKELTRRLEAIDEED